MSTTLLNAEVALSKDIGDYWASTTTSAGNVGGTTLVDTALMAKANDWITDEAYDMLTEEPAGAAAIDEERKISSLDNSTGTLTTLAHGGQIPSGIDYRVHRLFSASDKRIALIEAAKNVYPACFKEIQDESLVSGNWLKDGSFEVWSSSTKLTYWTETTSTVTRTYTAGLFKHGSYAAVLSTAAGTLSRTITNDDDLMRLAGKTVTFTVQGKCATANCLRIGIYDGTTTTYSSYLDQTTGWTEDDEPLKVVATIQDHPSAVTFYIYHDVAAGVSYVDDARAITSENPGLYIGNLGLHANRPHQVSIEPCDYHVGSSWEVVRDWIVNASAGYIYLPDSVTKDLNLRVRGIGYLDFYTVGTTTPATTWTATIDLDEPQLKILSAEAALYLYTQMSLPNYETGTRDDFAKGASYWANECEKRKAKFGMKSPSATVSWGLE